MDNLSGNLGLKKKENITKRTFNSGINKKTQIANPDSDEEFDSAKISRRRRNKKVKYHHISNKDREEIITRVLHDGEQITKVAKSLNINYSTVKSILQVFRYEGRIIKKDPLSVKEEIDLEKQEIENSELFQQLISIPFSQKFKKKISRGVEHKSQRSEKPVTRRSLISLTQGDQKVDSSKTKNSDVVQIEPKPIKKLKNESTIDVTAVLNSPKTTSSSEIEEKLQQEKSFNPNTVNNNNTELNKAFEKLQNKMLILHSQPSQVNEEFLPNNLLSQKTLHNLIRPTLFLPQTPGQLSIPFYIPHDLLSGVNQIQNPLEIQRVLQIIGIKNHNALQINPFTSHLIQNMTGAQFPLNLNREKL